MNEEENTLILLLSEIFLNFFLDIKQFALKFQSVEYNTYFWSATKILYNFLYMHYFGHFGVSVLERGNYNFFFFERREG